jgi:hypothetical protein
MKKDREREREEMGDKGDSERGLNALRPLCTAIISTLKSFPK